MSKIESITVTVSGIRSQLCIWALNDMGYKMRRIKGFWTREYELLPQEGFEFSDFEVVAKALMRLSLPNTTVKYMDNSNE
jgi:hypothetical protein